jgi:hypothetical protein
VAAMTFVPKLKLCAVGRLGPKRTLSESSIDQIQFELHLIFGKSGIIEKTLSISGDRVTLRSPGIIGRIAAVLTFPTDIDREGFVP